MTRLLAIPCALSMFVACVAPFEVFAGDDRSLRAEMFAAMPEDMAATLRARALPESRRFAPNEVLAILRADTPLTLQADGRAKAASGPLATTLAKHGVERFSYLRGATPAKPLHRTYVRFRSDLPGFDPEACAAELRATGLFRAVIPNYSVPLFATLPNDPLRSQQWHIDTAGPADIKLPEAWDLAVGSASTTIAIMDTGIDYTHPDLASVVWTNPGETPLNGIDDDGNGFVDDDRGWDFGTNDRVPLPETTFDAASGLDVGFHGTHCAGIAAAATNNAVGIAGASWGCSLMALKVSDPSGGITDAAIAGAFLYAADMGADVLSMSFGGPGGPGVPEFFQALVDDATDAGVLCVAAAGNDGASVISYPAACDDVLAIGATDDLNARASFSTYGPWVDLAAPGQMIFSTICQNYAIDFVSQIFFILFFGWDGETPYMLSDGTSMACPLAAGVCALVKSQAPGISPQALAQLMIDRGDIVAYDQPIGKKVNAFAAVQGIDAQTAVLEPSAASEARAGSLRLEIAPNPIGSRATIRWTLARPGIATVSIFDLTGRGVRTLAQSALSAGLHEAAWDGIADDGRRVANGLYLVRAECEGEVTTGKVVLVR